MKQFYFDNLIMENIYSFLPKTFTLGQKIIYNDYTIIIKKRTAKFINFILYNNEDIETYAHVPGFDIEKSEYVCYKIRKKLRINNENIEYFITNRRRYLRKKKIKAFMVIAQ